MIRGLLVVFKGDFNVCEGCKLLECIIDWIYGIFFFLEIYLIIGYFFILVNC